MSISRNFVFPDMSPAFSELIQREDKTMVIVGVIGKSSFPDCNKMSGFQFISIYPSLMSNTKANEGNISFYFEKEENILYLHFETTYDNYVMLKLLNESIDVSGDLDHFVSFNSYIRSRFARLLLFAIQVCHIIVLVETSNSFDVSYLSLFKSLKIIREKYVLKFLPKLLKNSNVGSFMGKEGRLCSPRFIFFFEKCVNPIDQPKDFLKQHEFDVEDDIYKMLRNEFIITNNSSMSLFSIPRNKRFVFFNTDTTIRADPLMDSIHLLNKSILIKEEEDDDFDSIRPFKGFAKPWNMDRKEDNRFDKKDERSLVNLLKEHVKEALQYGFDDSMAKFRGKSHFVIPTMKAWYDTFKILHKIFIENPDNPKFEANDPDYRAYLENFHKIMDIDERFFNDCCSHGLESGISRYKEMLPHHYNKDIHEQRVVFAFEVFIKYAKGPQIALYEEKLRNYCEMIWMNGKQQCEYPSLRGNPCTMLKHTVSDPTQHSSGVVIVSTCNCGRTQGHREDPYTIRQANYEFYHIIGQSCASCNKLEKKIFPIFQPSIHDFRAAELLFERNMQVIQTNSDKASDYLVSPASQPLESIQNSSNPYLECLEDMCKIECDSSETDSMKEIVIKVGDASIEKEKSILRQPSTTEYLPGMVHTLSPIGLLPQFPSWSLVCIGPSSIYSHNTGLPEHVQSGFLTGANFLLPWDVQVRLEHAAEWVASYEKSRNRKKTPSKPTPNNLDSVFSLKIFVGIEYECPRGHRFIMCAPDKILRGGGGIVRDSGSKVVFNDMPLYFPCPCRTTKQTVAQLMRVHIVTPKAPVNVILEPKIRPSVRNGMIFVTGFPEPAKLSQSTYWILRLPYIYQGDDGLIIPPSEVTPSTAMLFGCLQAGMFGITETETVPL